MKKLVSKLKKLIKIIVIHRVLKKKGCTVSFKTIKSGINPNNIGQKVSLYGDINCSESIKIGDYTAISPGSQLFKGDIGRFCSIGQDSIIGPHEHPLNHLLTHAIVYHKPYKYINDNKGNLIVNSQKDSPIIKDNVWIGARSIILRGVTIGEGAVIAANSVVTKDVAPYSIVAGVPAKVIKNRKKTYNLPDIELQKLSTDDILKLLETSISL